MRVHLIGVVNDSSGKSIIGFRFYDADANKTMDVPYASAYEVIKSGKATVEGLVVSSRNKLSGSNGALSRYPIANSSKNNQPLVIIEELGDIGYIVSDVKGMVLATPTSEVIAYSKRFGIANGKVVTKDNGTEYISCISGNYIKREVKFPITLTLLNGTKKVIKAQSDKKEERSLTAKKAVKSSIEVRIEQEKLEQKQRSLITPPLIRQIKPPNTASQLKDKHSEMTVDQKLVRSLLLLRITRPFYYAILANVSKIETSDIQTMGVSINELFYNPEFLSGIELSELVFANIHECMHIAYMHRAREKGRIHTLWNTACDLFINKLIAVEFGIEPGGPAVILPEDAYKVGIKMPKWVVYSDRVDVTSDTAESIYEELLSSYNKNKNKSGKDSSSSGDTKSGSGSSKENSDNTNQENNDNSTSSDSKAETENSNQNDTEQPDENNEGQPKNEECNVTVEVSQTKVEFRGKGVSIITDVDIVDSQQSKSMSDSQKNNEARKVLERASVIKRQMTGSFGGPSSSIIERMVEKALAPKVNWTTLLKNKLTKASQKVTTYSSPDRRFLSRSRVLPGPRPIENDTLDNVKVCVDTSGSISNEDLGVALAQIQQLLKQFKAKAEIMYWDTDVRQVGPFNDFKELLKIKPAGGGGTDVNCVFEYFETGNYKKGIKQKPSIIIIFTDGYFGTVNNKYKKYKDTIWVIHGDQYDTFNQPFGHKAKLTMDK